jgi:hypothetical protein
MEEAKIEYKINGIDLIEKHLFRVAPIESAQYNFEIKSQSILSREPLPLVVVFVSIDLTKIGDTNPLAKFFIGIGFEILNPDAIFKEPKETSIVLPIEVENFFKSIAISTSRGIIYSELRGTTLHNAILPVIDMATFKPISGNLIGGQ